MNYKKYDFISSEREKISKTRQSCKNLYQKGLKFLNGYNS